MSLLSELKTVMEGLDIPVETGVFKDTAPDRYTVLTPITDALSLFADNTPQHEVQEVRVSVYDKSNYTTLKNTLTRAFLAADITVTDRRYIGHEDGTGYYHYAIDVAKLYQWED